MKVFEKRETERAYTEAMQELQKMYDELFYEDIKRGLAETAEQLRVLQEEIAREVQESKDQTNGVIGALREDFAEKLKVEVKQLIKAIAEARTNTSQDMVVTLNHLNVLLQEGMGQRKEELSGRLQDLEKKVMRQQEQGHAALRGTSSRSSDAFVHTGKWMILQESLREGLERWTRKIREACPDLFIVGK